jgi:RNA polymerase-associated protein
MNVVNKKTVIVLYSGSEDMESHRTRIVLSEKQVTYEKVETDRLEKAEEIADLNPYGTVPILVDRDLVLFDSNIIMEYLDERFPHPPLLPVYPIARAKCRLMVYRIDRDWYSLARTIQTGDKAAKEAARKELTENLISIAPVFKETPYFLNDDFTIVDCCMAPLLWRLPLLGIKLPASAAAVEVYAERLFERPAFMVSLTELEREMR